MKKAKAGQNKRHPFNQNGQKCGKCFITYHTRYKYCGNTIKGRSSVHLQCPVDHSKRPLNAGTS